MKAGQATANEARTSVSPLARQRTPEEVTHGALFYASELSSFVNSANLVVNGGRTGIAQGCYNY